MPTESKYADNLACIEAAQEGDREALGRLAVNNAGLVRSVSLRFSGRGYDPEDLFEIGNLGLIKAVKTFDASRGCAFSTYAVPLIFGEIRRFIRDDGPIKVSRETKRLAAAIASERERAAKEGEDLRLSALAERLGVTVGEAAEALEATSPVRSLSDLAYPGEDAPTLEETLADEGQDQRVFDKMALGFAIGKLPVEERKIILLRYYRDFSQQKVADLLGLSQVKVSRTEKKALDMLRRELT